MSEDQDKHDKMLQKEALKEIIQEKMASFGIWSLKTIFSLFCGALVWLWIQSGGFHK